jgi:hypothetical protein
MPGKTCAKALEDSPRCRASSPFTTSRISIEGRHQVAVLEQLARPKPRPIGPQPPWRIETVKWLVQNHTSRSRISAEELAAQPLGRNTRQRLGAPPPEAESNKCLCGLHVHRGDATQDAHFRL